LLVKKLVIECIFKQSIKNKENSRYNIHEVKMKKLLLLSVIGMLLFMGFQMTKSKKDQVQTNWVQLLGVDHAKHWDIFMGVPHGTVKNLEGVDPTSDGKMGTPLGLNNDPKKVFTFEKEGDEVILHISGEIFGALTSKEEYSNYHLRLQYKWGEKVWEPRLTRPRDSGILYHCREPHAMFWNVWMQSQEFQIEQGNIGDLYLLAGTAMDVPAAVLVGKEYNYEKGAELVGFSSSNKAPFNHCNKGFNNENPHGEWNTLDLICYGDSSLHVVNGKVVMALFHSGYKNQNNEIVPLKKGKLQIQSEAAEIFYKNISIKPINSIPKAYKNQF